MWTDDVTSENSRGGWRDRAIVGIGENLRSLLKAAESWDSDRDQAIFSKIVDATEENNFENTIEVFLKAQRW